MFFKLLSKLYVRNKFLFNNIDDMERPVYEKMLNKIQNYDDGDLRGIGNSLQFLMRKMEEYYHKKVMVFIDEYDTPFIEAHVNDYYKEIRNHLASLLHNTLKSSTSLQYAMLTGIQRVAKENIFSDLNNPVVCTVKDDDYNKYFGFTENETEELLEYYGLDLNQEVKAMYDGYRFGSADIYNPWSIINYAQKRKIEAYWVNSSSNIMIKNYIRQVDQSFNQQYETLITQAHLETTVLLETCFYDNPSVGSLWGLLMNAGYLTIDKQMDDDYYRIRIPNQEVQKEFKTLTSYYLNVEDNS